MLPNFLIAGGVATGTSFLSATLTQHPDVYLPRIQRPEPNFFHYSWKYEQGIDWYQQQWFSEVGGEHAIGERSSLLLPSDLAPERIARHVPGMKFIFCLRNPIERAWANFRFTVLEGLEPLTFEEALETESERLSVATGRWAEVQPHAYVARSRYSSCLNRYLEVFGTEQVFLLKSEDLGANPRVSLESVCKYLGIDSSVDLALPPNYTSPSVVDPSIQRELRSYFGDEFPSLIECIRREENAYAFVKSEQDAVQIDRLRRNLHSEKEPMPTSSREVLRTVLQDELNALAALVPFSTEDWV